LGKEKDALLYDEVAARCKKAFNDRFWNEKESCLFDVITNTSVDASIRPNQIFAVSLSHSMVSTERAKGIVDKVETDLLTPSGLRSLSPSDPAYVPAYIGTPFERDSAYHQGTVWAWLIGPFIDAYINVYPDRSEQAMRFLDPFRSHVKEAGIGQISEIFDAERPHPPRGCFAQAWSVAEVLRILSKNNRKTSKVEA
jgi:glycogen debranching enzyme